MSEARHQPCCPTTAGVGHTQHSGVLSLPTNCAHTIWCTAIRFGRVTHMRVGVFIWDQPHMRYEVGTHHSQLMNGPICARIIWPRVTIFNRLINLGKKPSCYVVELRHATEEGVRQRLQVFWDPNICQRDMSYNNQILCGDHTQG